ncbi:MAG TPA: HD domain-containing protein [Bryobacteraceae bacterium]|jgi:phosphonate degradation associated HDIG domain protein|nr:HD domain-containing protein [Bryobacteraceae bacterium]
MTVNQEIAAIFEKRGAGAYFGEPVSQLEHALQAAHFACHENAPDHMVVAALLHDVGHLLEDVPEDIAEQGVDARHEEIGLVWLKKRFGPEVSEPVYLHVTAKRYLCATDPDYFGKLSPASVLSLQLQGGPMMPGEVQEFEKHRYFREAVQLRRWDDRSKIEGLPTPSLDNYASVIERCRIARLA